MLQKKRDEFRKQIRKNQLDKYRQQKRKTLLQQQINFEILHKVDNIFKDLQQILISVSKKYQQNYSQMMQTSQTDEPANISHAMGCFQQLKCLAPYQFEQVFTKYMIDKKSTERVMKIFEDLIKNQTQISSDSNEQFIQKYNPILRDRVLYETIKFLDTISYLVIGYECTQFIINGIWNVLTQQVLFSEIDNFGCLRYILSILTKLLEDTKNETIYRYLVKKGIGSQVIKIIDRIRKVKVPLQIHDRLLHLIDNYLAFQLVFSNKNTDKIGDVTIQTSSVNQKQIFLVYCVVFIDKDQQSFYSVIFAAISKIIQLHEFLASSLKDQYLIKVSSLILHPDRNIQTQSLNLLNDFTYYSQHCIDLLLKQGFLLNILHKRLLIETSTSDNDNISNIERISYIICNSLLTENKQLKKLCLTHYIWEDIYNSFHPSQKLFPLIMVMMYFFEANGHKNFDMYLRPYLETLRNFQWQECRYSDSILKSITNTFYLAQAQWQEHEYHLFLRILNENGFLSLVEDYCEPEDLKQVKGIEME